MINFFVIDKSKKLTIQKNEKKVLNILCCETPNSTVSAVVDEPQNTAHHRHCRYYQGICQSNTIEKFQNFCEHDNINHCHNQQPSSSDFSCWPKMETDNPSDCLFFQKHDNIETIPSLLTSKLLSNNANQQSKLGNKLFSTVVNTTEPQKPTKIPLTLLKNFSQNVGFQSYEEVLYLIKYILVYRIASLKNLLPYSNFVVCY